MDTFLDGLGVVLTDEQNIRIKVMEETERRINATVVSKNCALEEDAKER